MSRGRQVVFMGELGSLQCLLWWWDQAEDTSLCKPSPSKWRQAM